MHKCHLLKCVRALNFRISHLDETISKADAVAEVVGPGKVPVEGSRVELCEDVHLVDPAVNAVAHGHVDQPVRAAYRHLQLNNHEIDLLTFAESWPCDCWRSLTEQVIKL